MLQTWNAFFKKSKREKLWAFVPRPTLNSDKVAEQNLKIWGQMEGGIFS